MRRSEEAENGCQRSDIYCITKVQGAAKKTVHIVIKIFKLESLS